MIKDDQRIVIKKVESLTQKMIEDLEFAWRTNRLVTGDQEFEGIKDIEYVK